MDIPTIVVAAIIAVIFVAIVVHEVKKRRQGKSPCGGNCSSCGCGCGK